MERNKNRLFLYVLCAIQLFIGLMAIKGGLGLVSDPSGKSIAIPLEWLSNSPFHNYFIPGLILLIFNGIGNVSASFITFFHNRYAGIIAALLGGFLILYMAIEIWFVGLRNSLQPLFFLLAVIEMFFGFKLSISLQQIKGVLSIPNRQVIT